MSTSMPTLRRLNGMGTCLDYQVQATIEVQSTTEIDRRLKTQVERSLFGTKHQILWKITVLVQNQMVTLLGCVPSYYLKQLAQTAVLNTAGVLGLLNRLSVAQNTH